MRLAALSIRLVTCDRAQSIGSNGVAPTKSGRPATFWENEAGLYNRCELCRVARQQCNIGYKFSAADAGPIDAVKKIHSSSRPVIELGLKRWGQNDPPFSAIVKFTTEGGETTTLKRG